MRVVCWFSCGAASAVAAKKVLELPDDGTEVRVVYCDTMKTEHPDNARFFNDVQDWLGMEIDVVRSDRYETVDDVFLDQRYMSGVQGAACTTEMKKVPRFKFQQPDDVHVFGFTFDEENRIAAFEEANPDLRAFWVLRDLRITKADTLQIISEADIELPAMYRLGYVNNNCLGCVKATSARYWNMIRRDFPEVFDRRAKQSRELGVRLTRTHRTTRIFLDELPEDYMPAEPLENIQCGPDCSLEEVR